MKTKSTLPAATLFAIVTFASSLLAQTEPMPNTPTRTDKPAKRQAGYNKDNDNKLSHADRNFFEEAAKSGMKEVEVSTAVKGRLTNTQVSSFADMMVTDHTAANAELQALAAKKGVTLPADKKDYTKKWSKNEKDLDEDYVKAMEDDHEEAVKLFEKASKSDDPDIAAFAQKTLPKLQQHLDHARTLKKTVK
jgi:putative membrane protein